MKLSDYAMLAEAKIREAQARGDLDYLPGAGQPLPADALAGLPAEHRAAARIYANLEGQPEEVRLGAEIRALRDQLATRPDDDALKRRIADLELRLSVLHELSGRRLLANGGMTFVP